MCRTEELHTRGTQKQDPHRNQELSIPFSILSAGLLGKGQGSKRATPRRGTTSEAWLSAHVLGWGDTEQNAGAGQSKKIRLKSWSILPSDAPQLVLNVRTLLLTYLVVPTSSLKRDVVGWLQTQSKLFNKVCDCPAVWGCLWRMSILVVFFLWFQFYISGQKLNPGNWRMRKSCLSHPQD